MPSPFSYDLRRRVIGHYETLGPVTLTSKVFSISRSTIYDWLKLKESSGSLKVKAGYQNGYSHKTKDLEKFKSCVEKIRVLPSNQLSKKVILK